MPHPDAKMGFQPLFKYVKFCLFDVFSPARVTFVQLRVEESAIQLPFSAATQLAENGLDNSVAML